MSPHWSGSLGTGSVKCMAAWLATAGDTPTSSTLVATAAISRNLHVGPPLGSLTTGRH
jgi:hypothetical protein